MLMKNLQARSLSLPLHAPNGLQPRSFRRMNIEPIQALYYSFIDLQLSLIG